MTDPRPTPSGVLELNPRGHGFLRNPAKNYLPNAADPHVPGQLIDKFNLAEGVELAGRVELPRGRGAPGPRLVSIESIEGDDPNKFRRRVWDELTPIDPARWIK